MTAPPPLPGPRATTWMDRNWKWATAVLLLVSALFVGALFSVVFGMMRASTPYQLALTRARSSPAVSSALGSPITDRFFFAGNIHTSAASGQAQFEIGLNAPHPATLYVEATAASGVWTFQTLTVQVHETKERINLLADPTVKK
jgi:hypothetical protein